MIRILATVFAGLVGLAFGSFLNVCLSRWPEGESVVSPRSHCRACGRTLAWWENVPVLSWLALCGHCRSCKAWISWRYPLVELAVGGLWAYEVWRSHPEILLPHPFAFRLYGPIIATAQVMILSWILVALAVLDAEHFWLPDRVTFPGALIGVLFAVSQFLMIVLWPPPTGLIAVQRDLIWAVANYVFGILFAGGLMLFIRWIYWLARRREGIGLGDAKLMAMLGAWLGLPGALLCLAIGVVLGAVASLFLLAVLSAGRGSKPWAMTKLPLGTFLCIGGIVSALWGEPIIAAYLRWSGLG